MKRIDESHVFTGIQRDLSVSKHPVQFLYDGRNIRLTAREGDSLLSITNEKSTENTNISISGVYLGHCVLNQYLVVFSTTTDSENVGSDYITRIDLSNGTKSVLFQGALDFHPNYLIEAIPSYETEDIQKVYWTDGKNQPRIINIVSQKEYTFKSFDFVRELQLNETITVEKLLGASGAFAPGVIQYAFTYFDKYGQETAIFYTTPLYYISYADRGASPEDKVENAFKITISGVDQNFEYLRIYSIQRTSINGTPICKRLQDIPTITEQTTGTPTQQSTVSAVGEPEIFIDGKYIRVGDNRVVTPLKRTINNFEYKGFKKSDFTDLRIKAGNKLITWGTSSTASSVIWVSLGTTSISGYYTILGDTDPSAGVVAQNMTVTVTSSSYGNISYIDTGFSGNTIDPTELLYKGGEVISAGTLCQKDNTLFLGDIHQARENISSIKNTITGNLHIEDGLRTFYPNIVSNGSYAYANQLTSTETVSGRTNTVPCAGFKSGETYRLGVQFQHKNGQWSEPILKENIPTGQTSNIDYTISSHTPSILDDTISVPIFEGTLYANGVAAAYNAGYRRVRAVVVYPELQDRSIVCQGVVNPTLYTNNHRNSYNASSYPQGIGDLQAQSDWFFRAGGGGDVASDMSVSPISTDTLAYTYRGIAENLPVNGCSSYTPSDIRKVEIQGDYDSNNQFKIDRSFVTLHSPDVEFDDALGLCNYENMGCQQVGSSEFTNTLSDISIQTETPTISNSGSGFIHKSFKKSGTHGIVSGLFYEDFLVEDWQGDDTHAPNSFSVLETQNSPVKWMVYLWNKSGSLNNDTNRPSDKGTASSILKKKIISNLRFATTSYSSSTPRAFSKTPQFYSSNENTILKFSSDYIYKGNVDTLVIPDNQDGMYFAFAGTGDRAIAKPNIKTEFTSEAWWKTFAVNRTNNTEMPGLYLYKNESSSWVKNVGADDFFYKDYNMGNQYIDLVLKKDAVRIKYKTTPHLVFGNSAIVWPSTEKTLPIVEITQNPTSRFGGNSEDALRENTWIPCGEPVSLGDGSSDVSFEYSWGDTYYQRYDCLKTYAFTPEDVNQVVEIGSFMLETHVNIDGRYDRNRGQSNNLNMSPVNFNLINPVYSQLNNFFTYKILPEDYYTNTDFPNQITWTKEKQSGADVDMWTNVTLASTYDMDGSKGKVEELTTWKDNIFCFQNKGISNILFNSRVQIPVSDGVPIEISNSYKVDGYKYISDGIGCDDKQLIMSTPQGVYFIDSVGSHLFHIGDGFTDISAKNNMTSIFKKEKGSWKKLLYDDINHDLYLIKNDESLCYSEPLGQFTSWMNYADLKLIETYDGHVFTMRGVWDGGNVVYGLWKLFEGDGYNNFFNENYPWGFTFVSNGTNEGIVGMDKTFTNVEFRANVEGEGTTKTVEGATVFDKPFTPFDFMETWNEYQHGVAQIAIRDGHNGMVHHLNNTDGAGASLKRKYRIWRCDIPRDNTPKTDDQTIGGNYTLDTKLGIKRFSRKPLDRMRNPWLYLRVQKDEAAVNTVLPKTEVHDIVVSYFV